MKVLIPCAGTGSRLGELTTYYNKALLQFGKRAVISNIIESYPEDASFLVALGFGGAHVRQYLELAYPERFIEFVEIFPYEGPKSGLGETLRQCVDWVDAPFFFHANDTVLPGWVPPLGLKQDTMFLHRGNVCPGTYRTVCANSNKCAQTIFDKCKSVRDASNYVGVCYIYSHNDFVHDLQSVSAEMGETEFFVRRLESGHTVNVQYVSQWYDTGSIQGYEHALDELSDFENLQKQDEAIYFFDERVLKFSVKESFIANRVKRAKRFGSAVPQILEHSPNFYSYAYAQGRLLSEISDIRSQFKRLLDWSQQSIWQPLMLTELEKEEFRSLCNVFYKDKTYGRVALYYDRFDNKDRVEQVNDINMPTTGELLKNIDWKLLSQGVPATYHGDYHFENILDAGASFVLLDWRQDFGGDLRFGDVYYDLAKLLHGLIINHGIIRKNLFSVQRDQEITYFDFNRKQALVDCELILKRFCETQGYDWSKVRILTALIFLNICGLHHDPYCHLVYYLGKAMLFEELTEE